VEKITYKDQWKGLHIRISRKDYIQGSVERITYKDQWKGLHIRIIDITILTTITMKKRTKCYVISLFQIDVCLSLTVTDKNAGLLDVRFIKLPVFSCTSPTQKKTTTKKTQKNTQTTTPPLC